jgi:hypothetical protein
MKDALEGHSVEVLFPVAAESAMVAAVAPINVAGSSGVSSADFLTDEQLERRLGKLPMVKPQPLVRVEPKLGNSMLPKSKRIGKPLVETEIIAANFTEEEVFEMAEIEKAAARYNRHGDVVKIGNVLRINVLEAENADAIGSGDSVLMDGSLSLVEENARLRVLCRRLTVALRYEQRRSDLTRGLVSDLHHEYLRVNPNLFQPGNVEHFGYLDERAMMEEWMKVGLVEGGFKSLFGWLEEFEEKFRASYHTPYLEVRNGRVPVRPNPRYADFPTGSSFEEFHEREVRLNFLLVNC